jgi:FMN phosphatase YigB (HAD superfamily)/ADP-ribose pyrophosphatase YjhB (NUDIX family)
MSPGPRVLFVDLDHTVMTNPFQEGVFPRLAAELAASAGRADVDAVRRRVIARSLELLDQRTIRANDWEAIARDVAAEIGGGWDGSVVELVHDSLDRAAVVSGAREALETCREQGWRVIAASQGFRRYQEPVLAHLDLTTCFDERLYTDDVGSLKRSLRFYGKRDEGASRVVVVGDHYVDDGLYPRHFGMTSVLFTGVRRTPSVEWSAVPHFELSELTDLRDVLGEVASDPRFAYDRYSGPRCSSCLGPSEENAERCGLCRITGTSPPADLSPLRKAGLACVREGRLLLCRVHAYPWLITPGGLGEEDEPAAATLSREVREELGENANLRLDTLRRIGRFRDRAAGAPDREVEVDLWQGELEGRLEPANEIAELVWWGADDDPAELSPVVRNAIVPALRQARLIECRTRSTSA